MKKLFKHFKGYIKECILSPLFKLFEASLELLVPLIVALIIDEGIGRGDTYFVIKMCLLLIALGGVGLVLSVTAQYFAAKAAVGFSNKLRFVLFSHIQSFSYKELDKVGTPTMITRITSDLNQVQNGVNLTLRLFLRSPFIVFGAMIMAFTIDVGAALIFVGVIPVLSIIVFGIMALSIPLYKKVQKGLEKILLKTRENLSGSRVIRAFSKEEEELSEFKENNNELFGFQRYVGKISGLMNPLTYVSVNIAIILLIKKGAISVYSGALTQGAVVALYNYMSQILTELIKLANLIINITKAYASGNRVAELLDVGNSMEEEKGEEISDYEVEFKNVFLKYNKSKENSLSRINFKVKKGETVGIIGGTGSGKTSLVNLIPRFYDASEGKVFVFKKDVKCQNIDVLREKIGIVPQKAVLFSGTIRDNLKWGNEKATDEEILKALEVAQAKDFVLDKKDGLSEKVEQGGKNLSGGQRQRLTIARALLKKPDILILDDSASALDFATEGSLRNAIKEFGKDITVFIVSQRTSSVRYADKIIVMEDGEISGIGTHDKLLQNNDIYKEIYYSQYEGEEGFCE